jgi:PAS domain
VLELEALTNDLDNLLSSTDIAVVFLDRELSVRRFTPAVSDLLELIPTDIGRPLAHLAQKFSGGDLIGDACQVMAKLVPYSNAKGHLLRDSQLTSNRCCGQLQCWRSALRRQCKELRLLCSSPVTSRGSLNGT